MTLTSTRRWEPVDAPVGSLPGHRSPEVLRAVLAQFDVVHNPRYRPEAGSTWCNIYTWDATRALHAEIPHWAGEPARELTVNATLDWLLIVGGEAGWSEVDAVHAAELAGDGHPVVAVWRNPHPAHHGHIAVLLPPVGAELRIAQAGARCLWDVPLEAGFGRAAGAVRFFAHD